MKKLLFILIVCCLGCNEVPEKEISLVKPIHNPNNYNVAFLIIDGVFFAHSTSLAMRSAGFWKK